MKKVSVAFHTDPKGWPGPDSWWRLRKIWHRFRAGRALRKAVMNAGHVVLNGKPDEPLEADVAVIWSWKQRRVIQNQFDAGRHVLVLERGFLQPRNEWISMSWNGFNGRGSFPRAIPGGPDRQAAHAHHLKPWKHNDNQRVLLVGQVPRDAALGGLDIVKWAQEQTNALLGMGLTVVYRPHPQVLTPCPKGAQYSTATLEADLANVGRVVVYNSTTAVESVLAGVPVVVLDEGSVAHSMGAHWLDAPLVRPDRSNWLNDLAWRQWTLKELADGSAWAHALRHFSDQQQS